MNYATLVQAIKDYTENTETTFVANIDNFIGQAERRIILDIDLPVFHKSVAGTMTTSNSYLGKPTDFLTSFSLAIISTGNVYTYLMPKDVSFMREVSPDTDDTGEPKYYGHFSDTSFIISPIPNANYTTELHYRSEERRVGKECRSRWSPYH